ncbi:12238_t:CDS:2 [Ambispora gerdemannii]|uniref:12238_t:CDS:1 n=1 Tax=Ambispora gerdemannii TaxID=144530 RepID=A0A9N8VX81_9GLOM|nr:12238_t:CDS:2 [Ambispora gerdemannii]
MSSPPPPSTTSRKFSVFNKKFSNEEFQEFYHHQSCAFALPLLDGDQFWPSSTPSPISSSSASSPAYINKKSHYSYNDAIPLSTIPRENQTYSFSAPVSPVASPNERISKPSSPAKKFFGKIVKKLNPQDLLRKRRGSDSSQTSVESPGSSESYEGSDGFPFDQPPITTSVPLITDNYRSTFHCDEISTSNKQYKCYKKRSQKKKRIHKQERAAISTLSLLDNIIISPNPLARSKHHSFSYPPHLLAHPFLSPDEKTMCTVRAINFSVNIYWAWPGTLYLSLPRTTSLCQFKYSVSRELGYLLPKDALILCHTRRSRSGKSRGMRRTNGYSNDSSSSGRNTLLHYLLTNSRVKMVDSDVVWGICMLLWPEDVELTIIVKSACIGMISR